MTSISSENSKRLNLPSGSKWEDIVGYSRVVRIGNTIEVSGTTAVNDQGIVQGIDNPYIQTKYIIEKIAYYLDKAGASLTDVVRTRIYVTDISEWENVGRAHGEYFSDIKPVTSMVEVSRLISPELLVEIEVTAIVAEGK